MADELPQVNEKLLSLIAHSLGLPANASRSVINSAIIKWRAEQMGISPDQKIIENIYKSEAITYFGLDANATWDDIVEAYNKNSPNNEIEQRRYAIARVLQLNKFLATIDEIYAELLGLGISPGDLEQ